MEIIKFHRELTECRELLPYTLVVPKADWFLIKLPDINTNLMAIYFLSEDVKEDVNFEFISGYVKVKSFSKYTNRVGRLVLGARRDLSDAIYYYSDVIIVSDYWQEYFNKHYTTLSFKCKETDQIQHIPLDLEFVQTLAVIDSENYDEVSTNISVNIVKSRKTIHRYRSSFLANELITRVIQALNSTWVWLDGKRCQLQGQIEQEEVTNGNFSTFEFKVQFHNKPNLDLDLSTYIVKEDNTTFVVKEDNETFLIKE